MTWFGAMLDLHGAGLFYSVPNVTLVTLPLIAAWPTLRRVAGARTLGRRAESELSIDRAPDGRYVRS